MADREPPFAPPCGKAAQILAAARTVFMEQGFGAASMDAIAKEAGVSKATLYAHFEGKERLFAAMIEAECLLQARFLDATALRGKDPRGALTEIGTSFLSLLTSDAAVAIYRVVIGETARFPELGRTFFASGPELVKRRIEGYLAEAASERALALDDPRVAAEQFIAMLMVPMHMHRLLGVGGPPDRERIAATVDRTVSAFLRLYGPGPG